MTRPALLLLAALSLLLARRSSAWRPLAASMTLLAAIDAARLWVAPMAQVRALPWWQVDVALVLLWPVALGVGLGGDAAPRLRSIAGFALALGAARPWLPRFAYLFALRLPRWALAALWVEAVARAVINPRLTTERAPLACSLILCGCHVADLLAGAWMCAPWEVPSWGYARAVTWAAYASAGAVMLATALRKA